MQICAWMCWSDFQILCQRGQHMIWWLLTLQLLLLLKRNFFLLQKIWGTHWHDIFLKSRCRRRWLCRTSSIDHTVRTHLKLACSCCISDSSWIARTLNWCKLRRCFYNPWLSRYQSVICNSILLLYLFWRPCSSLFIASFIICWLFHHTIKIFTRYPSFRENNVGSAWRPIIKLRLQLIAWSELLIWSKWLETCR